MSDWVTVAVILFTVRTESECVCEIEAVPFHTVSLLCLRRAELRPMGLSSCYEEKRKMPLKYSKSS